MQDYRPHIASPDEPWWAEVAERRGARYQRAVALSRFRRELASPAGLLPSVRTRARWARCLEHWRSYLDGEHVA